MSITDELREYTKHYSVGGSKKDTMLSSIADRIDVEYQKAIRELNNLADASVLLPVDADGVPIHVGDTVTCARSVWEVTGLRLTGLAWGVCCTIFNEHGGSGTNVYPPCDLHHYHKPTVEDVLREMFYKAHIYDEREMELLPDLIAEYAAKLRLADDKEQQ